MIFISKRQFEEEVRQRVERIMRDESIRHDIARMQDQLYELNHRVSVMACEAPVTRTANLTPAQIP